MLNNSDNREFSLDNGDTLIITRENTAIWGTIKDKEKTHIPHIILYTYPEKAPTLDKITKVKSHPLNDHKMGFMVVMPPYAPILMDIHNGVITVV